MICLRIWTRLSECKLAGLAWRELVSPLEPKGDHGIGTAAAAVRFFSLHQRPMEASNIVFGALNRYLLEFGQRIVT